MKSILFLLKIISTLIMIFHIGVFLEEMSYPRPDFFYFWIASLAAFFVFQFHLIGKRYVWENDYWYLLFKTASKKYSAKMRNSKEKMRNELKDE